MKHLLVAIGPSPTSAKLIDRAVRATSELGVKNWIAVSVETPAKLSASDERSLQANLQRARDFGAQVIVAADADVVRGVLNCARQHDVGKILIGKPVDGFFRRLLGERSPVDRLIRESDSIDVWVVDVGRGPGLGLRHLLSGERSKIQQYLLGLAFVAAGVAINFIIEPLLGYWALGLIMLFAIVIQSLFTGRGPILLSAILGAALWNFLFIPPKYAMRISKPEDMLLIGIYFTVALVTGSLATRSRARETAYRKRGQRATALFEFARELVRAPRREKLLEVVLTAISNAFDIETALCLSYESLSSEWIGRGSWRPPVSDSKTWEKVLASRSPLGFGAETPTSSGIAYLPLLVPGNILGIVALRFSRPQPSMSIEERSFLESLANQAALFLERELLMEAASRSKVLEESERLHRLLLNSVSHELRTPLAAIKSATTSLQENSERLSGETRATLLTEIGIASERLNRLIENLLDMSRLESGQLKPKLEWVDVVDLVSTSIQDLVAAEGGSRIQFKIAVVLPLIKADFVLLSQALRNLVHNALTHTPPSSSVEVEAGVVDGKVELRIRDHGNGIDPQLAAVIFEKFVRAPGAKVGGIGLGLAIARGFVQAQGGEILIENAPGGGACFRLLIPLESPPAIPSETLT